MANSVQNTKGCIRRVEEPVKWHDLKLDLRRRTCPSTQTADGTERYCKWPKSNPGQTLRFDRFLEPFNIRSIEPSISRKGFSSVDRVLDQRVLKEILDSTQCTAERALLPRP
ncbi:NYN domain-containing protein [Sesbania bispinosa]|nr:NYN domain-containing protein [Sesbania bispinosa]